APGITVFDGSPIVLTWISVSVTPRAVAPLAFPGPQIALRVPKSPGPGAEDVGAADVGAFGDALAGADVFEPPLRPQADSPAVPTVPTAPARSAIARRRCLDTISALQVLGP